MSEIDLELVKLRATVRGWTFESNDGDTVGVQCKYGGWIVYRTGKLPWREHPWGNFPAHKRIEAILTAPRWTLARLLSEPPEGWRAHERFPRGWLSWGDGQDEVSASVTRRDCRLHLSTFVGITDDLARLAERHKAAAELAYILAEIQP